MSAQAFSETRNGRQQTTDGLWLHRGNLLLPAYADLGSARVSKNQVPAPNTGQGMELLYNPSLPMAYIQVIDRDASALRPLTISASSLTLPAASIGTQELEPGAVQALIGSYVGSPDWSLPQSSVLTETPMQVTCTFSGALVRFEFAFLASIPTKGQRLLWQLLIDGTGVAGLSLGAIDAPEAAYAATVSGVYYWPTPTPGSHRVGLGFYGPSGSRLHNHALSTLYVTEQRR